MPIVFLLLASAFFSSAEIAFMHTQRTKLRHLAHRGDERAQRVELVLDNPDRFLITILVGNNLVNTAVGALATLAAVRFLGETRVAALAATLAGTLVLLLVGEITPKIISLRYAERMSLLYIRPIEVLVLAATPLVVGFSRYAGVVTRLLGNPKAPRWPLTAEEIKAAVDASQEKGTVEASEAAMVSKVFELSQRHVEEIMTPRPEIVWVPHGCTYRQFLEIYASSPHSRYPVQRESVDQIVGVLSLQDVTLAVARGQVQEDTALDFLARPPQFIPETKPVGDLLAEMQGKAIPLALVVDEFGGTAGLVTLNTVVQEVVGTSEAMAAKEVVRVDSHTLDVDASLRIGEVEEKLGLVWPPGDYETIAGFILDRLGHIPAPGERLRTDDGTALVVKEMKGVKIVRVLIVQGR
ncbi:MAG: HlyC/CorC family transporter [Chloroflexi bacterium]|nr:HlyC/CorC family transporter [Chloroflexota bacterium]